MVPKIKIKGNFVVLKLLLVDLIWFFFVVFVFQSDIFCLK